MTNKAYLEPSDIELMESVASSQRDKLLIQLLFRIGCRVSEALALTIEDIDLINGIIKILHLKTRSRILCPTCNCRLSKVHHFCPKCGIQVDQATILAQEHRKVRTLPISPAMVSLLREFIEHGGLVSKNGKQYIFGINRHRAWQIVRDCARKAGLPDLLNPESGRIHHVSPHRLRDAFAVHAVKHNDSGDGLRLLQEHLGHSSFNTTAKYRKVAGEEHRRWYQNLWD